MDLTTRIEPTQEWKGTKITFDPDSSPKAWEYYKHVYGDLCCDYDLNNICFFEYVDKGEYKGNYTTEFSSGKSGSRLYALKKDAFPLDENGMYYPACLRLSGETDFNFNDYKIRIFKDYLRNGEDLNLLASCSDKHHTLVNFSLMQTVGNMQALKSKGLSIGNGRYEWADRLDSFVYILDQYFKDRNDGTSLLILNAGLNANLLKNYLSQFKDAYEYCNSVYLIDDDLIDRLLANGSKPLSCENVAKEYLLLANEFWKQKASAW
ncbi:MAG: hypothetical protein IKE53_10075 [Clostridiales bacterium]|nr:hypothetical protein [Clostridiales bacterium]